MRKSTAKTATKEATTTSKKRRLSNVTTRAGETLTSAEENVVRMNHGLEVGLHAPLPSNAVNAALRQYLLEIEKRAYLATGRHLQAEEDEDEAPRAQAPKNASPAKEKIVAKLRKGG
jgi:hypothetical protein